MKKTLAYDSAAKQFKSEIYGKKFYLGGDAATAEDRKKQISRFRSTLDTWTPATFAIAKKMAKGERHQVPAREDESAYYREERELVEAGVPIIPAVTTDDLAAAEVSLLKKRIADLEAELKEFAGPRVAERSTVTVAEVFRAWHEYRKQTAVYPGTTTPTDAVRGEGTIIEFVLRQLTDPDLKLAHLDYAQIDLLCKRIAARPAALNTGSPISRPWAKESLKVVRRVVRWAARTYGYRRPEEWEEATKGQVRWDKADQLRRMKMAELIYSPHELRTLYRYALPNERLLLLLALNCGFRQREITALQPDEIKGDHITRFRDKSDIYAAWRLWPETVTALATSERPHRRGKVTRAWQRLLGRVAKDHPDFRRLSFKRLAKTGSTAMRRIASGEIATMYISHGETTEDDLLEDYAAPHWQKLYDALTTWRNELDLAREPPGESVRTMVPLSKLDLCRNLWTAGEKVESIVRQTGLSRATCYRYRPAVGASGSEQASTDESWLDLSS